MKPALIGFWILFLVIAVAWAGWALLWWIAIGIQGIGTRTLSGMTGRCSP
jgi:hypothetical protein